VQKAVTWYFTKWQSSGAAMFIVRSVVLIAAIGVAGSALAGTCTQVEIISSDAPALVQSLQQTFGDSPRAYAICMHRVVIAEAVKQCGGALSNFVDIGAQAATLAKPEACTEGGAAGLKNVSADHHEGKESLCASLASNYGDTGLAIPCGWIE
jgi:hypothetical protein